MLHESTFEYLKPTEDQLNAMAGCRKAFTDFAYQLDANIPASQKDQTKPTSFANCVKSPCGRI